MPFEAPVTKATLPASLFDMTLLLVLMVKESLCRPLIRNTTVMGTSYRQDSEISSPGAYQNAEPPRLQRVGCRRSGWSFSSLHRSDRAITTGAKGRPCR